MAAAFVEAEGTIHLIGPLMGGEFTLCGDAFDLSSDLRGYEWKETRCRTVTCPYCAAVIRACRGIRVNATPSDGDR